MFAPRRLGLASSAVVWLVAGRFKQAGATSEEETRVRERVRRKTPRTFAKNAAIPPRRRAAMPVKRPVDDDDDGSGNGQLHPHMPAVKASRHDLQQHQQHQHQHQDYDAHHQQQQHAAQHQASARKKGVSNRTGQACDRCKVRIYYSRCYVMSYIQHACIHTHTHL